LDFGLPFPLHRLLSVFCQLGQFWILDFGLPFPLHRLLSVFCLLGRFWILDFGFSTGFCLPILGARKAAIQNPKSKI
jgi:hypothetical protein